MFITTASRWVEKRVQARGAGRGGGGIGTGRQEVLIIRFSEQCCRLPCRCL